MNVPTRKEMEAAEVRENQEIAKLDELHRSDPDIVRAKMIQAGWI